MDQFAWTKEEALYYMGILMSAGAVIACATFVAIGPLCKRQVHQVSYQRIADDPAADVIWPPEL